MALLPHKERARKEIVLEIVLGYTTSKRLGKHLTGAEKVSKRGKLGTYTKDVAQKYSQLRGMLRPPWSGGWYV